MKNLTDRAATATKTETNAQGTTVLTLKGSHGEYTAKVTPIDDGLAAIITKRFNASVQFDGVNTCLFHIGNRVIYRGKTAGLKSFVSGLVQGAELRISTVKGVKELREEFDAATASARGPLKADLEVKVNEQEKELERLRALVASQSKVGTKVDKKRGKTSRA